MERAMLGIATRDRHRSTGIMAKTGAKDIVQVVKKQKWIWAGHVARKNDNKWTKRITDWCPYNDKTSKKRPGTRWRGEIEIFAEKNRAKYSTRQAVIEGIGKDLFSGVDVQGLLLLMLIWICQTKYEKRQILEMLYDFKMVR